MVLKELKLLDISLKKLPVIGHATSLDIGMFNVFTMDVVFDHLLNKTSVPCKWYTMYKQ